ncbi:MAG: lipoate---protein ligase [Rubrobacteraceae bacterium]|nr:lipoate---protein ligase [Rubrobacteraceae bacterium]
MNGNSSWRKYSWHLIDGGPQPPAMHMALDEVLTRYVGAGKRPPTLRFWRWSAPAVILGRFQSVRNEVDEETAGQLGIQVVRRMTGGGAMFVEPDNAITYSIYTPPELVAGISSVGSYAFFDEWVIEALRSLGIDAWYEPINDITSSNGKIGGAAQARKPGAVLHHVTMSYEMDAAKMLRVLRIGQEKVSDKAIQSVEKRVGPLRHQTQLPREEIIQRMISTFAKRNTEGGLVEDSIAPEELAEAKELERTRYGTREWTYLIP